jgi:predicted RNA-binding Zn ribbon-like protein
MLHDGVLQLHHPDGQVFRFDPGSLAFAFSVTGHPFDQRFETLREPRDVRRWAADVLGAPAIRATSESVGAAKGLRAAIWATAEAIIDDRPIPDSDRSTLNAFAVLPSLVPQLGPDRTRSWVGAAAADALFSSIARDMIEVATGHLASRVRRCQGVNCAIPFVDTSRPGNRRWCSMDRCGNRAKVTAHRRRHRQEVLT